MLCGAYALSMVVPATAAPRKMALLGQYIRTSQAIYPLAVGDWKAVDEHRFETADLGASIRYRHEGMGWSDVYVYPAGPLTPAQLEQTARYEVAQLQAAAGKAGSWDVIEPQPVQRIEMQGAANDEGKRDAEVVWGSVMRLWAKGRELHSVLLLGLRNMYYVKLRYTVPADQESGKTLATARALFEPFMQQLRIDNRGGCFDPLPLVATQGPLDARAPGMVAAAETDGKVIAVATGEQVLVRDLKAPEALMLQYVASSRIGRIGPGCVPPDGEPQVPEGMREMRFEYPDASAAPSAAPSGSDDAVTVSQG